MHDLNYEQSNKPGGKRPYQDVYIAVLPVSCQRKDINILEISLQMSQSTLLEYSWVTRALAIRDFEESNDFTEEEILDNFKITKAEKASILRKLNEANKYLAARGWKDQYKKIEDADFAFQKIASTVKDKKLSHFQDESTKEAFRKLVYQMIDIPKIHRSDRLYNKIPNVGKYLPTILEEIEEQFETVVFDEVDSPSELDNALGIDVGESSRDLSDDFNEWFTPSLIDDNDEFEGSNARLLLEIIDDVITNESSI